ncbi:hypothetical protein TTY48_22410 [Tsukamurella sp. TY48]|nr:hypothetical protein TTY48_22410 [Tsukamurella sp. TY48]
MRPQNGTQRPSSVPTGTDRQQTGSRADPLVENSIPTRVRLSTYRRAMDAEKGPARRAVLVAVRPAPIASRKVAARRPLADGGFAQRAYPIRTPS